MKILIATPSTRGSFTAGYVTSLTEMVSGLRAGGHVISHAILTQALVSRSRDMLASKAMEEACDYVWMIDDDMQWDSEATRIYVRLMQHGVPIIATSAPAREHAAEEIGDYARYKYRFPTRFVKGEAREWVAPTGEATIRTRQALTVGTGFMAIKVSALEAMTQTGKFPHYKVGKGRLVDQAWRFFAEELVKSDDGDVALLGEDESFVMKAREWCRISTHVPIDVLIGHEGMHMFKGRVSDHWETITGES